MPYVLGRMYKFFTMLSDEAIDTLEE